MPKLSIVVPFHWMDNWPVFLTRCLASIEMQTFKDYEVILVKHSTMPITSNRAIESAKGELVKVLYMDDYLAHENALKEIVGNFPQDKNWLVTGCLHDDGKGNISNPHTPTYSDNIYTGANGIGSPSVLTLRREGALFFDNTLSWLLDCDLYKRLHNSYGPPTILNDLNVIIGQHPGQMTHKLSDSEKLKEAEYLKNKYS